MDSPKLSTLRGIHHRPENRIATKATILQNDRMKSAVPVFRMFDEAKAKEFYCGFLGFSVDWEHRFGEDCPLYLQLSRDACIIHLSEHHGDACPGSAIRIETPAVEDFSATLRAKNYPFARPGIPHLMPWGNKEITIGDPFGNRLTFYEVINAAD